MLKEERAKIAAILTAGVHQSGKLPVDAAHVAGYFSELYNLIAELDTLKASRPNQGSPAKLSVSPKSLMKSGRAAIILLS